MTTIEEWDVERCPQCGEEYFASQVLRELESLMAQHRIRRSSPPLPLLALSAAEGLGEGAGG